jgi:hypothetical protein
MGKIIVVEDNQANKLALLLSHNAGHSVLCATDAKSGPP